ncbi:MAG: branched-chain amino acid ABC transporter permease [Synergistaceae bacterium]|nr:branched-chain amino acid ABC transporter permease [Synergistaceae bacterium]
MKRNNTLWNFITVCALGGFLWLAQENFNGYYIRILNLIAINAILALGLNLIYGMTGMFSLGHAGFMAIGAYVSAILVLTPAQKATMWILEPIIWPLSVVQAPFWVSVIAAGAVAALAGWLIAVPVLRLGGDYLGIATLGFAEIIRILITNMTPITNGSLGLKGIPSSANLWVTYGCLVLTLIFMVRLMRSSTGNIFRSIRDDEIAAKTMGVNTFKYRVLSFTIGSFFAGIGGALMGNLITTIDPKMFMVPLTFQVLMIVVVGGLGSISGSIIGSIIVTFTLEWLRIVEYPFDLGFMKSGGIPGLRMVIFSALLILVIILRREGIMGTREFPILSKDRGVA